MTVTRLLGREMQVPDGRSFASIYEAYFQREEYKFSSSCDRPLIIDGGANAGIGIHYWKRLCPHSRVVAFEPDPEMYQVLKSNCGDLPDVTLREAALWIENGVAKFSAIGRDGGHLSPLAARSDTPRQVEVRTLRMRDMLTEPIELLKLDIEGAEIEVLQDCADRLQFVRWLFVEYHSFLHKPQRLGMVFSTLENAGFRIYCRKDLPAQQPFMSRPVFNEKDLHLNIFAFRNV